MGEGVCLLCGQGMKTAPGCVQSPHAYAWGDEPDIEGLALDDRCGDCGTLPGHGHHFGCCVGLCRLCSDAAGEPVQWLFCDHWCEQADALGLEPPDIE